MKYRIKFATQFKKDIKQAKKQKKDLEKLFEVVEQLAQGKNLESKYRDHLLSGNYKGIRECHIEPDWLLIYESRGRPFTFALQIRISFGSVLIQKLLTAYFIKSVTVILKRVTVFLMIFSRRDFAFFNAKISIAFEIINFINDII